MALPQAIEQIIDALVDVVPIHRWLDAVRNVLNALSLAFIITAIFIILLILNDWGFSPEWRIGLIVIFSVLLLAELAVVTVLALMGDALYNPEERALGRGKKFGTERRPRAKKELRDLPKQTEIPGLPEPDDTKRQLPRG